MLAMSATPRRVPTETTNPLSWKVNASSGPAVQFRVQIAGGPLAFFQRDLGRRGQDVPGARAGHRGEVAGGVDLGVVSHAQVLVNLDAAVVAGRQPRIGHQLGCFQPTARSLPVARVLPSGLNATEATEPLWWMRGSPI